MNIAEVKEKLYVRLDQLNVVAEEQLPDWYNQHDYSSGYFMGQKKAALLYATFLKEALDIIEQIKITGEEAPPTDG